MGLLNFAKNSISWLNNQSLLILEVQVSGFTALFWGSVGQSTVWLHIFTFPAHKYDSVFENVVVQVTRYWIFIWGSNHHLGLVVALMDFSRKACVANSLPEKITKVVALVVVFYDVHFEGRVDNTVGLL